MLFRSWRYGDIAGYTQTPAGGQLGSSSLERPRFAELGYEHVGMPGLGLRWQGRQLNWQVYGERIRLAGASTLQQDLITRSIPIPAGARIDTRLDFDWYRFGAGWPLALARDWQAMLELDAVLLDFDSQVRWADATIVRNYHSKGARAGATLRWQAASSLAWVTTAHWGYHAPQFVAIDEWSLALEWTPQPRLTLALTVGEFALRFEDRQTLPNRLLFEQPQTTGVGLYWRF